MLPSHQTGVNHSCHTFSNDLGWFAVQTSLATDQSLVRPLGSSGQLVCYFFPGPHPSTPDCAHAPSSLVSLVWLTGCPTPTRIYRPGLRDEIYWWPCTDNIFIFYLFLSTYPTGPAGPVLVVYCPTVWSYKFVNQVRCHSSSEIESHQTTVWQFCSFLFLHYEYVWKYIQAQHYNHFQLNIRILQSR